VWQLEELGPERGEELLQLGQLWRKLKREANNVWSHKRDQFNTDPVIFTIVNSLFS